ncbi:hypothetical protein FGO68_gene3703 [Halteria grandinella]|uniref:Uncharacterized protein n=1 Tax=Halteria grandinella TaxID=5974 RepID=A0A8J8NGT6_HALGN|nr:hypothetical protein FGO68_gene3703 [Halteria grandinella]
MNGEEKLEEVKELAKTNELPLEVQPQVQQAEEDKQDVVLENFTVKRSKRQLVACSQPRYINFDQSEAKANEFTMIEAKQIDLIYSQSDLPLEAKAHLKLQIASSKYQLVPQEPLPQEDPLPQEEDPLQDSPVILQVDPEKPISNSEAPSSDADDLSNHDQQDSQEEDEPFVFVTDQADMALREAKQRDLDQQNEGFAVDDRLETCNEKESEESKEDIQARNIRTEENDEILPRATESFEGEITPKHLSEVSSGKSRELSNQEPEESKEILQPTLENMKRIELKNQRRDIGGSLATSNILDLINLHQNSMHGSDDPQQPPLLHYTSQNAPQTSKNLGSTMMPPRFSLRQPALHNPFSTLNKARSLFQEPITHQQQQLPPAPSHYKLHQSQHSGKSMGSKIGFLMKSIDGGALFTRGALHKEIQNSNGGNSSIMEDAKAFQNHDDSYHQEEVNDQYYNTGGNTGNAVIAGNAGNVPQQPQKREDTQESQEHESPDSKNAQKQRLGHMFMAQPGMVGFGLSGMMGQMAMMKNMNRQQ